MRRRTVLLPIVGMTGIIVAGVFLFNSVALKELLDHQHSLKAQLDLLAASSGLFRAARDLGFERGRVNVLLNGADADQDIREAWASVRQLGGEGDRALATALEHVETFNLSDDADLTAAVRSRMIEIAQLRIQYEQAITLPRSARDPELDDRWFALMSRQIADINGLLYAIKEGREFNPGWDQEFDALYLVSLLRDDAGPLVSYLGAAVENGPSLTIKRMREIRARRRAVQSNLGELTTLSRLHLDAGTQGLLAQFKRAYVDELFGLSDAMLQADVGVVPSTMELETYLSAGVHALETLNALSESVYQRAHQTLSGEISRSIWRLRGGVALSIVTLLVPILSFTLVYRRVFRRIVRASHTINQLAVGHQDVDVAPAYANDEMGDVESGLLAFRARLQELDRISQHLLDRSTRDSLTGLTNHAEVLNVQAREHANALRHGHVYTVLMIDIDHFKSVNDHYGHPVGDTVLRTVALALQSELRAGDLVGRYGGEEFMVLLPQTALLQGVNAAQKLRLRVEQTTSGGPTPQITVSIGVAEGPGDKTPEQVVAHADRCLYQAKRNGRNRVEHQQPDTLPATEVPVGPK